MQIVGDFHVPDGDRHFVGLGDDIEHYQEPQRLKALEYVTNFSRAVDLGAHIGIFSRHFARLFDEVVAFEPTPETRACLEKNVPANVRIIPYACGDREQSIQFRRHLKNSGGTELWTDEPTEDGRFRYYSTKMVTLDSLNLDQLGLIKIDIQGAEPMALRGGLETLRRCRPVVLIEEKPVAGTSFEHIEESRDILLGLGFEQRERVGADRIYVGGATS
jgi:FkbM family methyltransferase